MIVHLFSKINWVASLSFPSWDKSILKDYSHITRPFLKISGKALNLPI